MTKQKNATGPNPQNIPNPFSVEHANTQTHLTYLDLSSVAQCPHYILYWDPFPTRPSLIPTHTVSVSEPALTWDHPFCGPLPSPSRQAHSSFDSYTKRKDPYSFKNTYCLAHTDWKWGVRHKNNDPAVKVVVGSVVIYIVVRVWSAFKCQGPRDQPSQQIFAAWHRSACGMITMSETREDA